MSNLPKVISDSFNRLKNSYNENLTIKKDKNGKFIVLEFINFDKAKRTKTLYRYVGHIDSDGFFIPAKVPDKASYLQSNEFKSKRDAENDAMKYLTSKSRIRPIKKSNYDEDIIRALSMNSRIPYSKVSKLINAKKTSLAYQITKLIKEYDIKPLLELNLEKLGYYEYIIFVKFLDGEEKINMDLLKSKLSEAPEVQLVLSVKGNFDMVVFLEFKINGDFAADIYERLFNDINVKLSFTRFYNVFGLLPIRDEFFTKLKESVWIKSPETPHKGDEQITLTEFNVLKALNESPQKSFMDIDKKLNYEIGTSRFNYYKLVKRGIIVRPTITVFNNNSKGNLIVIMNILNYKEAKSTIEYLYKEIISKNGLIDKYNLVGDIENEFGELFIAPITMDNESYSIINNIKENIRGVSISTLIVKDILIGTLPYRNFDMDYSNQYKKLVKNFGYKENSRVNYQI